MKLIKWLAASAALAAATMSQAATYNWSFTDTSSALLGSGSLSTSNTLNSAGGYDLLSISGTVTGYEAITGLVPNPNQPNNNSNFGFIYDNVIFATSPHVSNSGILFTTSGVVWNIYRGVGGAADAITGHNGINYIPNSGGTDFAGSFALTAVPEPATWAMMIGGFGLAGVAIRRRRTEVATAAIA